MAAAAAGTSTPCGEDGRAHVEKFLKLARKARPTTNGNGHHADPEEALRRTREFNARQEALQRAANTTPRGAQLAAELAAQKGASP